MFKYLLQRETDNLLRTATRTLAFPDGTTRTVTAYRLCWIWFDRILGPFFGHDRDELLGWVLQCMQENDVDEGEALKQVLDFIVQRDEEKLGVDYTDDPFMLDAARAGSVQFEARKAARRAGGKSRDAAA